MLVFGSRADGMSASGIGVQVSYNIAPYAVDLAWVKRAMGCGDQELADLLVERLAGRLDRTYPVDETFSGSDALTRMIIDPDYVATVPAEHNSRYAFCFEALCGHFGMWLSNDHWCSMRYGWFGTVDKALESVGVGYCTSDLVGGWAPVELPRTDDFPFIGYETLDSITGSLARLEPALTAGLEPPIRDAVAVIIDWYRTCLDFSRDLVCFYY